MRIRLPGLTVALVLAFAGTAVAAARPSAGTPVPAGFVGVNLDGPPLTQRDHVPLESQFQLMASNGVESVRATFVWSAEQPYKSSSDVPAAQANEFDMGAGGVP